MIVRTGMILIAEDEANARQLFATILSRAGYECLVSEDGEEALGLLRKHRVDLVIADLVMPKLNGFALISEIRAKSPRLPIVLVSGYLSQEGAKKILDDDVEFIPKPVDRDRLLATVNRLLPA